MKNHNFFKDRLTGAATAKRQQFPIAFQNSVNNNLDKCRSFALLMLDLDGFQTVNDKIGQQSGHLVLSTFSKLLLHSLCEKDQVFRYGADEFVIILHDAVEASCLQIAERIQKTIADNALLSKFNISCSIGSSYSQPDDNLVCLLERAEQALFCSKNRDKNCMGVSARVA